jgi:hypothetical protein
MINEVIKIDNLVILPWGVKFNQKIWISGSYLVKIVIGKDENTVFFFNVTVDRSDA